MRALVARPGGRLDWRDVPEPRDPGPGGAVVHPLAVPTPICWPVSQVVEISGTPRGLWTALSKTAPDGVCSSGGSLHYGARIPASLLYGRNVSLHIGRAHTRTIIPHVLDLMTKGILRPEGVTTQVGALDDAPRALRAHMFGTATKTILTI